MILKRSWGWRFFWVFLLCGLGLVFLGRLNSHSQGQKIRVEAAAPTSLTFMAIGDTHAGKDPERWGKIQKIADFNHAEAIKEIIRINPDFYLHLGDMVEKSSQETWNSFFEIEKPLQDRVPVYPVIGNHEQYQLNNIYYISFQEF